MKDLDFDELDKAVNSLMVDGNYKEDDSKTIDEPVLVIDSTQPEPTQIVSTEVTPVSSVSSTTNIVSTPVSSSAAVASKPLAMRRSGRFMDVVHASSDMTAGRPSPSAAPSRTGTSLSPLNSDIKSESTSVVDSTPEQPVDWAKNTVKSEIEDSVSDGTIEKSSESTDWPDPIALSESLAAKDATKQDESNNEIDSVVESINREQQIDEPLSSPFLAGAKVEKRPLGSTASEIDTNAISEPMVVVEHVSEEVAKPVAEDKFEPNAKTAIDADLTDQLPTTSEEQLPTELQDDLMAIESDSGLVSETEQPIVSVDPPQMTGPASIPQQYTEEPQQVEPQQGGIYDTKDYHQPLAHPAKKKSGWLWVVWIVLLIILGVAGGAALYLFVL